MALSKHNAILSYSLKDQLLTDTVFSFTVKYTKDSNTLDVMTGLFVRFDSTNENPAVITANEFTAPADTASFQVIIDIQNFLSDGVNSLDVEIQPTGDAIELFHENSKPLASTIELRNTNNSGGNTPTPTP